MPQRDPRAAASEAEALHVQQVAAATRPEVEPGPELEAELALERVQEQMASHPLLPLTVDAVAPTQA